MAIDVTKEDIEHMWKYKPYVCEGLRRLGIPSYKIDDKAIDVMTYAQGKLRFWNRDYKIQSFLYMQLQNFLSEENRKWHTGMQDRIVTHSDFTTSLLEESDVLSIEDTDYLSYILRDSYLLSIAKRIVTTKGNPQWTSDKKLKESSQMIGRGIEARIMGKSVEVLAKEEGKSYAWLKNVMTQVMNIIVKDFTKEDS